MPNKLWAEALIAAVYLYNRTPHSSINFRTPFEAKYGIKPNISNIKIWGSLAYRKEPKEFVDQAYDLESQLVIDQSDDQFNDQSNDQPNADPNTNQNLHPMVDQTKPMNQNDQKSTNQMKTVGRNPIC
ncbi:hypothetical protein BM1_08834 [Bipolaris maydis]|nr:hypothetical protein BM1_08834 [Bipolaris maydis]